MTAWTSVELAAIADADELRIASKRSDGTLREPVIIWVVRDGDDLYVRAYKGRDGAWFRGARQRHQGHIQAGGIDEDVTFIEESDAAVNDRIDTAYRTKYGRYGATYLDPMVADAARAATLRLVSGAENH